MRFTDNVPLLILITTALASCANLDETRNPSASPTCPPGAALITVGDGFLQTVCGCAEPAPVYTTAGQNLVCTVPTGTLIQFHYLGTSLRHQIAPVGTPSFPASPLSDPTDPLGTYRVHSFRLDSAGTYRFQDLVNAGLTGDLIAL